MTAVILTNGDDWGMLYDCYIHITQRYDMTLYDVPDGDLPNYGIHVGTTIPFSPPITGNGFH